MSFFNAYLSLSHSYISYACLRYGVSVLFEQLKCFKAFINLLGMEYSALFHCSFELHTYVSSLTFLCVCACMCVCVHVCMRACMHMHMYSMYVCVCVHVMLTTYLASYIDNL